MIDISKTWKKLDKKENDLKAELETARGDGDEAAVERISECLLKVSQKRALTRGYIKKSKEKTGEDHKVKKKRKADDEEVEDEKEPNTLRLAIYDDLIAQINPVEGNGEMHLKVKTDVNEFNKHIITN